MHWVDVDSNVDSFRFEPVGFRRSDHSETLRSSCVISNPLLRLAQGSRQHDWITFDQTGKCPLRMSFVTIQESLHELRHIFSPKRPHRDGEMKAVIEMAIGASADNIECLTSRVFAVGKPA